MCDRGSQIQKVREEVGGRWKHRKKDGQMKLHLQVC